MNSPYTWETMTDEEMAAIIRSEGTQLTPDQVTTEFISGMRNYGERYRYHPQLLAVHGSNRHGARSQRLRLCGVN